MVKHGKNNCDKTAKNQHCSQNKDSVKVHLDLSGAVTIPVKTEAESSHSPETSEPPNKKMKHSDSPQTGAPSGKTAGSEPPVFDTTGMIKDIQETITASVNQSIEGMVKDVVRDVTANLQRNIEENLLTKLSDDLFLKLGKRIADMEKSMIELNSKVEQVSITRIQTMQDELDVLKENMSKVNEAGSEASADSREKANVVVKGLPLSDPVKEMADLATAVGAKVDVHKIFKIPGNSGVIIVTLDSKKQVNDLLQKKKELRKNEKYKTVYIEPEKGKEQRIMEANIRKLVQSCPNLQWKKGKIVSKDSNDVQKEDHRSEEAAD